MYGHRLAQLRKAMKLSQQELADRLSITRSTYAQYEINRREPDFKTIIRLADFFDVSLDYIFEREDRDYSANTQNTATATNDLPSGALKEIESFIKYIRHKYSA